ncbi:hypothetical protein MRB53_038239 [Persea americana]|nr:hypothetical protein MRB53_038239 [Persea americana]
MANVEQATLKARAEALVPQFRRRISLLGTIGSQSAILQAERAAFSSDPAHLTNLAQNTRNVQNLGANDIYNWFLASTDASISSPASSSPLPDLKLNLIFPCTSAHIAKYSAQAVRVVTENPAIYAKSVAPYISAQRASGRLAWVYNILDGRTEQEDVLYRHPPSKDYPGEEFLLMPDLNWDRRFIESFHLLALPLRRDIASLRDLHCGHVDLLRRLRETILSATEKVVPGVSRDQVKLYLHYQPTYYHLHVHVVHVMLEAGATQAVGKAWGLDLVIEMLEAMGGRSVGETKGMKDVSMTYTIGEASELWKTVFATSSP